MYDLCRKYRYFHKKKQDIEGFDGKYHDIDLTRDIMKVQGQLELVEKAIMKELLDSMDVCVQSIDIEHPTYCIRRWDGSMSPYVRNTTADVSFKNGQKFIMALSEYAQDKYGRLL